MKEIKYFLADAQSQLLRASEEHHVAMESMLKSLFDELGHQFEFEQQRLEAELGLPLGSKAPVPVSLDCLVAEKPEEPGTADPCPSLPTGGSETPLPMIQSAMQSMEAPSASDCISPYETDYSGNSAQAVPITSNGSGLSKRLFSKSKQNGPGAVFFKNEALQSKVKKYLNVIAGGLVMMNSLVMMVELELEGRAAGVKVGLLSDDSAFELSKIEPIFQAFDTAFVYIFLVECLARITVEGSRFFRDLANWFDFGLVVGFGGHLGHCSSLFWRRFRSPEHCHDAGIQDTEMLEGHSNGAHHSAFSWSQLAREGLRLFLAIPLLVYASAGCFHVHWHPCDGQLTSRFCAGFDRQFRRQAVDLDSLWHLLPRNVHTL